MLATAPLSVSGDGCGRMKDSHFAKQEDTYPRTFPFADLRPEGRKQRLNVSPADRAVDWASENRFQRGFVTLFDAVISIIK